MTAAIRRAVLLLSLIGLAFALRVSGLTAQSLWRDEVDALRFATQAWPDLLAMFRKPGENGPLYFLALRPWLAIAGHTEFALRFPSALAGTLAVPIVYLLVQHISGERRTAAVAGLLMATTPYAVWYGQEAKMYAALLVWAPLSLYLALRAYWQGGWWRWALLYIVTSLGFYTHLLSVLIIPVQAAWFLVLPGLRPAQEPMPILRSQTQGRRWLRGVLYLALLILPYLPLARWQAPMWLAAGQQTGYPFVPLPTILLVMLVAFSRGIQPVTQPVTLLPAVLALAAGVGGWALISPGANWNAGRRWRRVALWLVWLVLPAIEIYGISLRRPIFADRYLIWTLPAFVALSAWGITALARTRRPLAGLLLAALLTLNLAATWDQTVQPIKSDFRAAAQFVRARRQPDDLLMFQIPYNRYTFAYYSGELTQWLDGPFTNDGIAPADLAAQMARDTAHAATVWLIASEVPMWDARNLTEAWLLAQGRVTDQADFTRVTVTRYALK